MPRPFVILDRDGTVIAERNYLAAPDGVELLPNAAKGLRALRQYGYGLIVVTNQSGVGRRYFDEATVDAVHARMCLLLSESGVTLDGIYYCAHVPEEGCGCRKPEPGLVEQAAGELGFDPRESVVIGDKACDIELGHRLGARTILVRTGYGMEHQTREDVRPDWVANDLGDAAEIVRAGVMHPNLCSDARERLARHLTDSIATKQQLLNRCEREILAAAGLIVESLRTGGKILLCGNGGSAADCQHIAAEFVSVLTQDYLRPGLPAIALTTDTSILTASANDFGFEGIFERQVQALGRPGDVLVGISTSGNSKNVVRALEFAQGRRIHTIALTGASGGSMAALAGVAIRVPSNVTMHVQEAHITVGHILCAIAERSVSYS